MALLPRPNLDQTDKRIAMPCSFLYNSVMSFAALPDLSAYERKNNRRGAQRHVHVAEDLFDGELTPTLAYWLGFLYADGSISVRPRWLVNLTLAGRDQAHVEAFHALVGGSLETTRAGAVRVVAYSKHLVLRLMELRLVPRKSYDPVEPLGLDGKLRQAYIRGMFDGDGCLHVTKRGHLQAAFCGHPDVVRWFIDTIAIPTNGEPRLRRNTAYAQWTAQSKAAYLCLKLYGPDAAAVPALARKAAIAKGFSSWLSSPDQT